MSEPKITMTTAKYWDGDYIKSIIEIAEKLGLGKVKITTGIAPIFNHKLVITFEKP